MSTEENHASGRPFSGRCPPSGRRPIPCPRSSAWHLKLPNINADKIAAEPAHAPALRRLFPIAQWLADKPAHILEFQLSQRPLDRKRQVPQWRQTLAQLTPRASVVCEPSGTSSNALRPSRRRGHDPHHHVPSIRQRSQPPVDRYRSETGCASDLAYPGPSSPAMTARTPTRFSSTARHPRRRRARPFGRPTPAEAVRRRSVSPFLSRSHNLAQGPDRSRRGRRPLPRQTPPRARNFDADRLLPQRFAPTPRSSLLGGSRFSSNSDAERRAGLIPSPHQRRARLPATLKVPPVPPDNDRRLTRRSPRFTDA